ncbi:amyloid-beta A4 precursor protein-binding family A member 2 [Gadus chalcogrammus]|uniref:amyloid-beta A4 precursor protein-binding family A member 2 n=1 Tax=Gadus chalcogrammus TaxID=1042646 RepID=UPI0024C48AFE|nr:amyloid-beta A4 precursor protein-binding family A member 2 [Gadus chalcogrammus]
MEEAETCSEYDNVGSDVEQDYDEVLHEACPDTEPPRPSDPRFCRHPPPSPPLPAPPPRGDRDGHAHAHAHGGGGEADAIRRLGYFIDDSDEIEEVLDGVRFVEDLEEDCDTGPEEAASAVYQCSDAQRGGKRGEERFREDRAAVARSPEPPPVASRRLVCEAAGRGSREKGRPGNGRGRRGPAGEAENGAAGPKGGPDVSGEPNPKMAPKDGRKAVARTKTRSDGVKSRPQPPPRQPPPPRHVPPKQAPAPKETPVPSPAPLDNGAAQQQESHPRAPKQNPEQVEAPAQHRDPLPDRPRQQERNPQGERSQPTSMAEEAPEQPSRPPCPQDPPPPEENNSSPQKTQETAAFPSFVDVPGPCEPEDLIDGIIFAANYLGCTQVLSDKNPSKSIRMTQAQEAVSHIKSQDEDSQMVTEVDLFISTKAVKVLNADTQETMMDSALRTISYIADIGSIVVLMARRRMSQGTLQDDSEASMSSADGKNQYRMICYVFESEDAQLIAQSIGQAFSVAYREFLRANGINPKDLSQKQYSDIINSQEMYNDDLIHFSNSDNCKELYVEKQKGEMLGVVIVESGWGSILPTVILANMLNSGPAARSGRLSVGDQIMSINDTSLVGLPLATCQGIIKGLKNLVKVKLSIVSCPPVTTVLIKRPDLKFQLGFSVQNGIICSLMRGGIAERGGVRVGHRIIEINGQSVVAMAHEKIVQTLSVSVGEINMKTMPAVMFRLLTGQETPIYI